MGDAARHSRSEEHTSELQSHVKLVCRLLLEKKKRITLLVPLVEKRTAVAISAFALAHGSNLCPLTVILLSPLFLVYLLFFFFFLMIRRPPRSTLFPTRRSSDLHLRDTTCRDCRSTSPSSSERNDGSCQPPCGPALAPRSSFRSPSDIRVRRVSLVFRRPSGATKVSMYPYFFCHQITL